MQIIDKKLAELIPYENNPRDNDEAVPYVANSIKEFGFNVPIVIDKDNVIVAGHTRYKACQQLGIDTVPCIVKDDLTDDQIKAYRLADNKVAEKAAWDIELLDIELEEIELDMTEFGFEEVEELEPEEVTEDEFTEDVEVRCKNGDVWKLGRHRLMCGDSTSVEDVENLMGGVLADLVVTDPPYNVAYEGKTEEELTIQHDDMDTEAFLELLQGAFYCMSVALKDGGSFYIWHASRTQRGFEQALNDNGLTVREQLIWNKNAMTLGRQDYQWKHEPCFYGWKDGEAHRWYNDRSQTTVLDFDKPRRNGEHPTMKPVELFDYQIRNSSKPGDNVLDLFGGSGTTMMACEQNGRNAYLMELDPHYCDVIINRWEQFTGERAVLENDRES